MELQQEIVYHASKALIGPPIGFITGTSIEGQENVPEEGAGLIVCNHRTPIDPLILGYEVDRPINFAAAEFSFKIPLVKYFFERWGAFSISLKGGDDSRSGIEKAIKLLQEGELIGIFPEGIDTIAKVEEKEGERISRFHTGFTRIAIDGRAPIIPACVIGQKESKGIRIPPFLAKYYTQSEKMKEGVRLISYRKVLVRVGKPISIEHHYGKPYNKELIDKISGKVRRILNKLYNGEDLDRFLYGTKPFDIDKDWV